MRRMTILATVVTAVLAVAAPVLAHGGGIGLVPVLDPLDEALPEGVEVSVVGTQVASLLEVANPTDEVLEVQQGDGTPWLRISSSGVEVASGAVDTYATTNPTGGSVPNDVLDGARENRWVRVTEEPRWSWFEHRMHPEGITPTATAAENAAELLAWEVAATYGGTDVVISGTLELRPPTGTISAELTSDVPDGIELQALPGGVPGLLLSLDGATEVVVVGVSGEDYLRFGPDGVEVDVASPTHRAVEAARGNALPALEGPAAADWQQVTGATTHAWLETRARAPVDVPEDVRTGGRVADLVRWEVPLRVDGAPVVVAGVTRWEPLAALDDVAGGGAGGAGPNWALVGGGVALGVAALVVAIRRRRAG